MSHRLTRLSGAALALVVVLAPAAYAADEPKDILERAIKAHGGADALDKFKAAQIKTKGTIDLPGLGEAEFTQETAYMIPDKFRETMELKVAGQNISLLTLVSGDKFTIEVNGKAIDASDKVKDAMKAIGPILEIGRLVPLRDKKYDLSIIGEDKVEGKKVVGIRVSAKGQKDVSVYFSKDTGLLTKLEYRTVDANSGNEVNEERIVTEYGMKNKEGMPVPKTVLIKREGKKFLEVEVLEHKALEKLDDSEFKK